MMKRRMLGATIAVFSMATLLAQQPGTSPTAVGSHTNSGRVVLPPPTAAQGGRPIQRFDRSALDLTPEQRGKLEEANKTFSATATPIYARLSTARRELDSLVNQEKPDEAAIKAKAKDIGDLEGEIAVARAQRYASFRTFLSAEQARRFNVSSPIGRSFQPHLNEGQTPPPAAPNK